MELVLYRLPCEERSQAPLAATPTAGSQPTLKFFQRGLNGCVLRKWLMNRWVGMGPSRHAKHRGFGCMSYDGIATDLLRLDPSVRANQCKQLRQSLGHRAFGVVLDRPVD